MTDKSGGCFCDCRICTNEGTHCRIVAACDGLDDDPDNYDPEDDEEFDCYMDQSGSCGKAGSEECDFECPYQNEI